MRNTNKFIIIHGGYGSPNSNWFPKISKFMFQKKLNYVIPKMPGGLFGAFPNSAKWEKLIQKELNSTKNIILISYSLGCIATLRVLEQYQKQIKLWILVAPPSANCENAKRWQGRAKTFFNRKIDFKKVQEKVQKILVIASSNDNKAPYSGSLIMAEDLKCKLITYNNMNHLDNSEVANTVIKHIPKDYL